MGVLIIAEKPSVASDLARVLGAGEEHETHWSTEGLEITWAIGHLLEMEMPEAYDERLKNWHGSSEHLPIIPDEFRIKPKLKTKRQLSAIKRLANKKGITEFVNACDAAREGELIFRRVMEHLQSDAPCSRMWMRSMTDDAIRDAWEHRAASSDFDALSDAAHARAEADWLIGMNGSRIATLHLPRMKRRKDEAGLSLGRVQTPTLAIVVDKELEVLSHVPSPYWRVEAEFAVGGAKWKARWKRVGHQDDPDRPGWKADRILDESERGRVVKSLESKGASAQASESSRNSTERPPLNFDLTTLQRRANSQWSWSALRTLSVAQSLYDRYKVTTYPRTDSKHLPEDMRENVNTIIESLQGVEELSEHTSRLIETGLQNTSSVFDSSKVSDHFAIIPTGQIPPSDMGGDESKLFDLIARTFLASFHSAATKEIISRVADVAGEMFHAKAERYVELGFREVLPSKAKMPEGWGELPESPANAEVVSHECLAEATKPVPRLKEARLLQLMEHAGKDIEDQSLAEAIEGKGIGTPATRADHIEKLIEKNYVGRSRSGVLRALPKGIRLIDALRRIPVDWIASAELTGDMEANLADVAKGAVPKETYMDEVRERTRELVERVREHDRATFYSDEAPIGNCPKCEGAVLETVFVYQCEHNAGKGDGCEFTFWKDTSSRWFDRLTASRLLESGRIDDLHGFFRVDNEPFTASVTLLEGGDVRFAGSLSGVTADDEAICPCPTCAEGTIRSGVTGFGCDSEDCKQRPLQIVKCHRTMTADDARALFADGATEFYDDFIGRNGRPFKARLKRSGTRVEFEFAPREGLKEFSVTPGVVAICPKTKAEIIETPTHFKPSDEESKCRINLEREVGGREMSRDDVKSIIEEGQGGPFELISKKTGKPYTAILFLKSNGRYGYRFAKKE